ncbi:MAG: hypothetical protein GYA51_06590 [Candidatus Methanofastidiosa archaeon]|nr:hypothetical protein [Candidatus Methanofastidiosa archaeon]
MDTNLSKSQIRKLTKSYLTKSNHEYEIVKEQIIDLGSFELIKNIWDKLNNTGYPKQKYEDFFILFPLIDKDKINKLLSSQYFSSKFPVDILVHYMKQSKNPIFIPWLSQKYNVLEFWTSFFTMEAIYQIGTTAAIKNLVEKVNFYYFEPENFKAAPKGFIPIVLDSISRTHNIQRNLDQVSLLATSPMLPLEFVNELHSFVQQSQLIYRRLIYVRNLSKELGTEVIKNLWMYSPLKNNTNERRIQFERNLFISMCLTSLGIKSDDVLNLIVNFIKQKIHIKTIYNEDNMYLIFAYDTLIKYFLYFSQHDQNIKEYIESGINHPNFAISQAVQASILYNNAEIFLEQVHLDPHINICRIHPIAVSAFIFSNNENLKLFMQLKEDQNQDIRQFASFNEKMILDQISSQK